MLGLEVGEGGDVGGGGRWGEEKELRAAALHITGSFSSSLSAVNTLGTRCEKSDKVSGYRLLA